jgi:Domain of unknown function (DUF4157)
VFTYDERGLPWRHELERFFDQDLSRIQVVTGPVADASLAHAGLAAAAYGERIYLSRSSGCRQVVGHEVAHVLQQTRGARWAGRDGDDPRALEREAQLVGAAFGAGRPGPARTTSTRPIGPRVQGHDSFEHRLLGDTPTGILTAMAGIPNRDITREQALTNACNALAYLGSNPTSIDYGALARAAGFLIELVPLDGSELLVTYGELNTMADYLTSWQEINQAPRNVMLNLVQMIRHIGYNRLNALRASPVPCPFPSMLPTTSIEMIDGYFETQRLDALTTGIGPGGRDHYKGVLARNACHFAPFTWWRWKASYQLAVKFAQEAYRSKSWEDSRKAWLQHGYADHFLQDAFAAGHLINKTLIMQWFVDWATSQSLLPVYDWDAVKTMISANQRRLWGPDLYSIDFNGISNDPQTSEELDSRDARMANTGIVAAGGQSQPEAYASYLAFLQSPVCQIVTRQVHDVLNKSGLNVWSMAQSGFQLWGDYTMLNGGDGIRLASAAATMSRNSIKDILETGQTATTWEQIFAQFPNRVVTTDNEVLTLPQWHAVNGPLYNLCHSPQAFESWQTRFFGAVSHVTNLGIVSLDQGQPPQFQPDWRAVSPAGWLTSGQCAACQWNGFTYVFYLPAGGSDLACIKASDPTDQRRITLPPTGTEISFAAGVIGGQLTVVYADATGTLTALTCQNDTDWHTTANYAGVTGAMSTKSVAIAQVGTVTYVMFAKATGNSYSLYYSTHEASWTVPEPVPDSLEGSNPSLTTDGQVLYVAFQHGNQGIYTGQLTGRNWTGPTSRAGIRTTRGTSLACVNGTPSMGYWAIDGTLHAEKWNPSTQQWGEMPVPAQQSVSPVTIAATFDGLAMLFAHGTAPGQAGTLGWLPMVDGDWDSRAYQLGAFVSDTPPLLAAYGATQLFTTVGGAVYRHVFDGVNWSVPELLDLLFVPINGGRLGGGVHVYNDVLTLWLASVRSNGSVQGASFDGTTWTQVPINDSMNAGTGSVAIADYSGQLYAFYEQNSILRMSVYNDGTGTWGQPVTVPGVSFPKSTVATVVGDSLYLGYICADPGKGTPTYTVAFDGQNWAKPVLACSNNASTVSLAGFANQLVMVYLGTNGMLYSQWITPGVTKWSIGVALGQALTAPALLPIATKVNDNSHAQGLLAVAFWPAGSSGSYDGMFTRVMTSPGT